MVQLIAKISLTWSVAYAPHFRMWKAKMIVYWIFTIRCYPVFEKWYPYPIQILFWLKSYHPYLKTIQKYIAIHNIHFGAVSILPHEAK